MILVGNQRGGAKNLADHLLKQENERVVVHELRGFASETLHGALQESYAVSRGTRCKQHLYSLSFNPPKEVSVAPEVFEDAVNRAEERLGLTGQPRTVVFHEKRGIDGEIRRHAHAVWCRIDIEKMKAVQLSFDKTKLNALGRQLYIDHGWTMPRGFVRHNERNPRNYSLAEWQQAKRAKKNPAKLKAVFQECWAVSDSQAAFTHALKERGYILARGNRGGIVAVDHNGEAYAVRTYVGIKPKQVKERIKDGKSLPDVIAARNAAAKLVQDRLRELKAAREREAKAQLERLTGERRSKQQAQVQYAKRLAARQEARQKTEEQQRRERIKKGWRGLIDRITGQRKRVMAENRADAEKVQRRDQAERKAVAAVQTSARQEVLNKARTAKEQHKATIRELSGDIKKLDPVKPSPEDQRETDRAAYIKKQRREVNRPRRRRSRDGPSQGPSPGR